MDDTQEQPDLLTAAEVASMLRVSKMTIYRLIHSGELPAVRVGRSFRIPRASLAPIFDGSRALIDETDVWYKWERAWRPREADDPPGRQQD